MGNALVDVLALIEDDKILEDMCLPKGSMQLIDSEKMSNLNVAIANMEKVIACGGSASNTITALSRLGIETGFIGKTGNDFYGDYFEKDLQKSGAVAHLTQVDAISGVAIALISKDGERTFGTYLGAAADLKPEDLRTDVFAKYDYLYIEGYLMQNYDLLKTALQKAKDLGLKIILDLASYNVVEENRSFLLAIIPDYVDIVFANEEESRALLNLPVADALEKLSEQCDLVIIKEGSKGSSIRQKDKTISILTYRIPRIDTTGAGDMYAAGFLYGLLSGLSFETAGKIGNYLAECVIQVVGAKLTDDKWEEAKQTIQKISANN
jgi:sugar/nucleoside kinase (ribokinase family)